MATCCPAAIPFPDGWTELLQSFSPFLFFDESQNLVGTETTPPTDGETIATWTGLDSIPLVATAGPTDDEPIYRSSGNLGIQLGGANELSFFELSQPVTITGPFTIYCVYYRTTGNFAVLGNSADATAMLIGLISGTNFAITTAADLGSRTGGVTVNTGQQMFRARFGNDGVAGNNQFSATSQAASNCSIGTNGVPNSDTYTYDVIGATDSFSQFTNPAIRIRFLYGIPQLITPGSADDLAIIAAINARLGTSLGIL